MRKEIDIDHGHDWYVIETVGGWVTIEINGRGSSSSTLKMSKEDAVTLAKTLLEVTGNESAEA